MKLTNKIVVVTGGSSGIGLAIAQRFVAEGAYVFITGRKQKDLDEAATTIGRNVTAVRSDATKIEDLDALFAQIKADKGRLDVVVANAGMNEQALVADAHPAHFDAVFGANVRSVFFTVQKSLPLLVDGGSIVLIASAMHSKGLAGYSAYSASKAAVRSFARTWAAELAGRKIRVNSLSPGGVDTALLTAGAADPQALKETMGTWIPMGRVGRTEELAAAALFFASSEGSYATGSDLVVDGGFTQL